MCLSLCEDAVIAQRAGQVPEGFYNGPTAWRAVPRPGMERTPPAVEAWSLNHWTAREVPLRVFKMSSCCTGLALHLHLPQGTQIVRSQSFPPYTHIHRYVCVYVCTCVYKPNAVFMYKQVCMPCDYINS